MHSLITANRGYVAYAHFKNKEPSTIIVLSILLLVVHAIYSCALDYHYSVMYTYASTDASWH